MGASANLGLVSSCVSIRTLLIGGYSFWLFLIGSRFRPSTDTSPQVTRRLLVATLLCSYILVASKREVTTLNVMPLAEAHMSIQHLDTLV